MLRVKTVSKIRMCLAFLLAPAIAGMVAFLIVIGQAYGGFNVFPSDPDFVADGAMSLASGVTLVAFFAMFGAAVPIVAALAKRGPLSLKQVVLVGVGIGQGSIMLVAAGILIAQAMTGGLSPDVANLWVGLYGVVRASLLSMTIGGATAAACWVIGIWGTEWDAGSTVERETPPRSTVVHES